MRKTASPRRGNSLSYERKQPPLGEETASPRRGNFLS